ncbi:hypothetical protein D3C73_745330 [compost metagenome]
MAYNITKRDTLSNIAKKYKLSSIYAQQVFENIVYEKRTSPYSPPIGITRAIDHYNNFDVEKTLLESSHVEQLYKIFDERRTLVQLSQVHCIDLAILRGSVRRKLGGNVSNSMIVPKEKIGILINDAKQKKDLCKSYGIIPCDIEFLNQEEINILIRKLTLHVKKPQVLPTRYVYGRTPNSSLGKGGVGKEDKRIPPHSRY